MKNNIIDFSSKLKEKEVQIKVGTYKDFFVDVNFDDENEFLQYLNNTTYKVPKIKNKPSKLSILEQKFIKYSYIWCLSNYKKEDKIHLFMTSIMDLQKDFVINLLIESGFDLDDEEDYFKIPKFLIYQCFLERNNKYYSILGCFEKKEDLINIFITNDSNKYLLIKTNNDIEFVSILQELDIITNYQMTTYLQQKYL